LSHADRWISPPRQNKHWLPGGKTISVLEKLKSIHTAQEHLDLAPAAANNANRCMPQKRSARGKKLSRKAVRDLDTKISFLEGIARRDPEFVEALELLGDFYTQRGEFDQSLEVDKQLSRLEPRNPLVFYNLACSYSLNGDLDLAAASLEKALTLGYCDFKWLAKDPDLRQLRKHPVYRTIEDKIRKMKIKVL
jgi:tetratricopeptide (TPR) repeat protein